MKRLIHLSYVSLFSVLLFACQKETVIPDSASSINPQTENARGSACKNYFYSTKTGVTQLGSARTDIVLVGFAPALTTTDKERILSRYGIYDFIAGETFMDSGLITLVQLKPGATCNQTENFMQSLQTRAGVNFALPSFDPQPAQQGIFEWVGLTNEFIVTLKNAKSYPQLQALARLTNTKIVTSLDDVTYILSADKKSRGNALEASTIFNRSPKVVSADPNFIFQLASSTGFKKAPERISQSKINRQHLIQ